MADIPPQGSEFIADLLAELKSDNKNSEKLNEFLEDFSDWGADFKKMFQDAEKAAEAATEKYEKDREKDTKEIVKNLKSNNKNIPKDFKDYQKKSLDATSIANKLLTTINAKLIGISSILAANFTKGKKFSESDIKRGKLPTTLPSSEKAIVKIPSVSEKQEKQKKNKFEERLDSFVSAFTGGVGAVDFLFGGQVATMAEYSQNMYEIGAQTQDLTSQMPELRNEWLKLDNHVEETGIHVDKFKKKMVDLVKRGIKDRKETEKVLTKSFNLARTIGADADQTADMFHEWHMQLGFNSTDLASMGRHMREIAKTTGVTGDNLLGVAKSSEQFIKHMKNAGTLTATAARNIIAMQTSAKKFGAEEFVGRLQGALGSAVKFREADVKTQSMLILAANKAGNNLADKMIKGTFNQSRENAKSLAEGMKGILSEFDLTLEDIEDVSAGRYTGDLQRVSNFLNSLGGIEAGEFVAGYKSIQESSMGYRDQLENIDKQLRKGISTQKKDELLKKRANIESEGALGIGLNYFQQFTKFAEKEGSKFEDVAEKMKSVIGEDVKKDLESMGISTQDSAQMFEQTAKMSVEKLKALGGPDLMNELTDALKNKSDMSGILTFMEKVQDTQAKLAVDKVVDNPLSKPLHDLLKVQELIQSKLQELSSKLFGFINPALLSLGIMAAAAVKSVLYLRTIARGGLGGGGGMEDLISGREGRYSKGSAKVRARAARINAARGGRFGRLGRGVGKLGRGIGRVGRGIGRFSGGIGGLLMAVHSINAATEALDTFNDPKKVEAITGINKISQTVVDKAGAAAGSYVEAFTFGILKAETLNNIGQQFGEKIYKNFQGTMDKLFTDNSGINDPIKQAAREAERVKNLAAMTPEQLKADNIARAGGFAYHEKELFDSMDRLVSFENSTNEREKLTQVERRLLGEMRAKLKDQSYLSGLIADLKTKGVAKDDPTMIKLQKSLDELVAQSKMSTELQAEFARIKNEHAEAPHAAWRYIGEHMAPELAKKLQDEYAKSVGGSSFQALEAADVAGKKAKGGALSVSGRSMMKINRQLWEVGESGPEIVEIKNAARMDAETKALDTFARVIPMMRTNAVKSILPIPDMHASVTKEKATEKQESDKITNEISDTNELMQEQIDLIKEQNSHLIKLVSLMSMSSGGGGGSKPTGTTVNDSGLLSPDYGKWQYSFYQIPGIQVTTEGD